MSNDKLVVVDQLAKQIRDCKICEPHLPMGANPVIQFDPQARLLIVGQAPGIRVHNSGIAFNDPSGDRLRDWLGVDEQQFYDARKIAIVPMGFCYPGTGKNGDLPPRLECATAWRSKLLAQLEQVQLTLVIGQYAMRWHLPDEKKQSVTSLVKQWHRFAPDVFPMPHPSPRNNRWLKNNPWFEVELLPQLKQQVQAALA